MIRFLTSLFRRCPKCTARPTGYTWVFNGRVKNTLWFTLKDGGVE